MIGLDQAKIAHQYLLDIYNHPNDILEASQSLNLESINFLIDHQFIEKDESGNYVLEPDTYDQIEKGTLEGRLIKRAGIDFDLWYGTELDDEEPEKRELSYKIVEPEKKPEKVPFLSKTRPFIERAIFLTILFLLWRLYFYLTN